MKILVTTFLLLTAAILHAQAPLDANLVRPGMTHLDINITDTGFGKNAYQVNYRNSQQWEFVKSEDGKTMKFFSYAAIFDYFDKQGFALAVQLPGVTQTSATFLLKRKE